MFVFNFYYCISFFLTLITVSTIDHSHNDIILCFLLQPPECIVYYLSKEVFNHMVCSQLTLQFSGLMIKLIRTEAMNQKKSSEMNVDSLNKENLQAHTNMRKPQ